MNDLELLTACTLRAGAVAMQFFQADPRQWNKDGGSPVSEADIAVDDLLRQSLLEARPDYGWLSEESHDRPTKGAEERIFVVDPIDGTRGFLKGDGRWCVSVAVIQSGRPLTGVLFAPALGRLLNAEAGSGAQSWHVPVLSDQVPVADHMEPQGALSVSSSQALKGARIEGPNSILKHQSFDGIAPRSSQPVPSLAWRFALVASGEADAAITRPRSHDWDLAACDLLVHEAGGRVTDLGGRPPVYNQGDKEHAILVAGNAALRNALTLAAESAKGEDAIRT